MRKSIIIIGVFAFLALIFIKSPRAEIFSSIFGKVVDAKTSKPLSFAIPELPPQAFTQSRSSPFSRQKLTVRGVAITAA